MQKFSKSWRERLQPVCSLMVGTVAMQPQQRDGACPGPWRRALLRKLSLFLAVVFSPQLAAQSTGSTKASKVGPQIVWESWSDAVFSRAKREHRLVILDLEAIWCHWCHVMAEVTYHDPEVSKLINAHYIAVRVDQDSRPDISNRYEDYGWPATVVFGPDGGEIIKRSGYIAPAAMASLLQAIVDDPTPGPSIQPEAKPTFGSSVDLDAKLRTELQRDYLASYDHAAGSWGTGQKYLEVASTELALAQAERGDAGADKMAKQTLTAQLKLIDPVWGGVYQYSAGSTWDEPHFEKIMAVQAENLRLYALSSLRYQAANYLGAARAIYNYLQKILLGQNKAFFTSQDADVVPGKHSDAYFKLNDVKRRHEGLPKIDEHQYARENGWAILAFSSFYAATGEPEVLAQAEAAAEWVSAHRGLAGGGFRHDEVDEVGPFLGDTLAMGRAFLALYTVTGARQWLTKAEEAAQFIAANFISQQSANLLPGFVTVKASTMANTFAPKPIRDENVAGARFTNLLWRYTGKQQYRDMAATAMRYLSSREIATKPLPSGVLLADLELTSEPTHITVVGAKDDPVAKALFQAALAYPAVYRRIEWWDGREGKLPNQDVEYPVLQRAAAFACTGQRCSLPIFNASDLRQKLDRLQKAP